MSKKIIFAKKKCKPCEQGMPPLSREAVIENLRSLTGWRLSVDEKSIECDLVMKNFMEAVRFINRIAALAEKENHHPDLHLTGYRNFRIRLSTHAIGGLSENDFILAAKIEKLPKKLKA